MNTELAVRLRQVFSEAKSDRPSAPSPNSVAFLKEMIHVSQKNNWEDITKFLGEQRANAENAGFIAIAFGMLVDFACSTLSVIVRERVDISSLGVFAIGTIPAMIGGVVVYQGVLEEKIRTMRKVVGA